MRLFIGVLVVATILGGFVVGELTERTFSITGAIIGGLGVAVVLLGLGAYFDSQAKNAGKEEVPPEVRAVFDRMLGKRPIAGGTSPRARDASPKRAATPTQKDSQPHRRTDKNAIFLSTTAGLIAAQLFPKFSSPKQAFGELMTNKRASGYLFGFHDAFLQRFGLHDQTQQQRSAALIQTSYKSIFGDQAGFALFSMSLASQDDPDFFEGRMTGGNDAIRYLDEKVPPIGLGRMLILGMKA